MTTVQCLRCCLAAIGFWGLVAANAMPAESTPNIIFVMADDLGYGDLGCYGQQKIHTPHLDQMAAEGIRFTDFYAGCTVCAPSRCVLMTGLHTGHCWIRGNAKINLRPDDLTVAESLKTAGYTCAMFGKWGIGHEGSTGVPTRQGFDEFVGYLDQHHAHNYYPSFLMDGEQRLPLPNVVPGEGEFGQGVSTNKEVYSHDVIMNAAFEFLDQKHDGPFFLYLPVTLPHANNEARQKGMEIPDLGDYTGRDWPEPLKGTAAMISRLDADMGRLFEKLQALNIDDQTIVFFTSDNGPHHEGGNDPDFFDSNGPLRGTKRDMYEGGIREPLIVRWPGRIAAGSTTSHVGYLGDIFATCCELAQTPTPENLDSVSLLPVLLGAADPPEHDALYWEFYEQGFKQAVRRGDWKYVRINRREELYNLADDLGEEHDLADSRPNIVAELRTVAEQAHTPNPHWKIPESAGLQSP